MANNSSLILVEISPTRHQLIVLKHGRVISERVERLAPAPSTPGGAPKRRWAEQLGEFQPTLSAWVRELELDGRHATVVYTGPDAAASVYSVPAATGLAGGRAAAELALGEASSYSLESGATQVLHIRTDSAAGVNADGSERPPQVHHLGVIDSDVSSTAVCQCVENAGLVVERCVPGPAAMLLAAWSMSRRRAAGTGACVVLWLGEQGSALVAGTVQRLAFARYLPHGVENLIEALARAGAGRANSVGPAGDPGAERARLRESLFACGISDGAEEVAGREPGLAPASLPVVHPIIQRLAIEIKQSARFGLSAQERADVRVLLAGPGARIPGIIPVLASDAGVGVLLAEEPAAGDRAASGSLSGESAAFLSTGDATLNVLPRSRREFARFASLRRALRVGVGIALLAGVMDAGQTYLSIQTQRETLAQLEREQGAPSPARAALNKAIAARVGVAQAKARLRQLVPDSPSPAAVLGVLGVEIPGDVRLRSIELAPDRGGWAARLSGAVRPAEHLDVPPADRLKQLLDRLAASPLVTHATLGPTHIGAAGESPQLVFDASIGLVGLPLEELRMLANRDGGERDAKPRAGVDAESTGGPR